jgi:DNA-binding beta-propeller fold protein YncE
MANVRGAKGEKTMKRSWLVVVVWMPLFFVPRPASPQNSAEVDIVWPPPPDPPRIRYSGVLNSDRDLGRSRSFFGRLVGSLLGTSEDITVVQRPHDVYVDSAGRMFITNGLASGFWVFDPGEKEARLVTPQGLATIGKPMGLSGDDQGVIYVADPRSRRAVAVDIEGNFVQAYGGETIFLNPVDVAVSPSGDRVYVADSYLHQVLIFQRDGTLVGRLGRDVGDLLAKVSGPRRAHGEDTSEDSDATSDGTPGHPAWRDEPSDLYENRSAQPGEFRYPAFLAVGPDGTVYVSDGMNFRVQAFDRDGEFLSEFGRLGDGPGAFARPKGIAVDSEGHVYVVDAAFNNVQVFDREGNLLIAFGSFGSSAGQLWLPVGIAIDDQDQIFVADRYNNRLQIFQYLGTSGSDEGDGSGSASAHGN